MSKRGKSRREEKMMKALYASVALLALAAGIAIAPYVLSMRSVSAETASFAE